VEEREKKRNNSRCHMPQSPIGITAAVEEREKKRKMNSQFDEF
jgi:hypothetical protein